MIINNIRLILCKIKFLKDITQNSGKGRENFRHREGEREGQRDSDEERERENRLCKNYADFHANPFPL